VSTEISSVWQEQTARWSVPGAAVACCGRPRADSLRYPRGSVSKPTSDLRCWNEERFPCCFYSRGMRIAPDWWCWGASLRRSVAPRSSAQK